MELRLKGVRVRLVVDEGWGGVGVGVQGEGTGMKGGCDRLACAWLVACFVLACPSTCTSVFCRVI